MARYYISRLSSTAAIPNSADLSRQAYDWDAIAAACNSTKGACSKRWSRLKLSFDRGDAAPSTPSKTTPATPSKSNPKSAPATPMKTPVNGTPKSNADTPTTASKRKKIPAKSAVEDAEDDEEDDLQPKRMRASPKAKARPKNGFRASDEKEAEEKDMVIKSGSQTFVKGEPVEGGGVFVDAPEEICKFPFPFPCHSTCLALRRPRTTPSPRNGWC